MATEFEQPESGKPKFFDKIALFSAVVSLLCVLGAHAMDSLSRDGTLSALARVRGAPGIDYSATASIGAKPANGALNPCGNR